MKNTRKLADHERKRQTRTIKCGCPFKMWIIHDASEDPPWRLKYHRKMEPHNHDGNPVSANVGNRNRGTQSDVARSSGAPPTSDDLVREIMRLNNRAQNESPTPANPSPSPDTVAFQTTTHRTPPIPKPTRTPDPGLISETFFVTRKTGNTCIVCSPCDITLDNSPSRKNHDASGKSASNPTRYTGTLIDDLDFDKFVKLLANEHGLDRRRDRLGFVEEDVGREGATAEPAVYEFENERQWRAAVAHLHAMGKRMRFVILPV
jgi:hypothetical protein